MTNQQQAEKIFNTFYMEIFSPIQMLMLTISVITFSGMAIMHLTFLKWERKDK